MKLLKHLRKRGLAMFMALVLCLSLVQVTAFAEDEPINNDVIQSEDNNHEHTWNEGVVTTPATCTAEGVKTFTCTVEGCGETRTEAISVIDHTPVTDARVEPTETETGLTEGTHCSVCNAVLTAQEVIPATGVVELEIPAEVQAFLDAVYALYDVPEEQMLQAVANAETLYNALTDEQKTLEAVYQRKAALDAFRETMTLEETETPITTEKALRTAISSANGGTVTLGENITLSSTLEIKNTVTLDLNGKTLTGNGKSSVIKVTGSNTIFTLKDSGSTGMVTGGKAKEGSGVYVGEGATFVMTGGKISGNTSNSRETKGAGVYVGSNAHFKMIGNASVSENTITSWTNTPECGAGVYVGEYACFEMSGNASVTKNECKAGADPDRGGGVYVDSNGTFKMSGNASVTENIAQSTNGWSWGGGIYVNQGYFEMSGNSTVSRNTAGSSVGRGGGIYAESATIKLFDNASIQNNSATDTGGGIALWRADGREDGSTMTMEGNINISNNTAKSYGGGITLHWTSTLNMTGGTISDNHASWFGGGIATWVNCNVILQGDNPIVISNNTCEGGFGGGIGFNGDAKVTMEGDVTISNNKARYGGGVGIGECGSYWNDPGENYEWQNEFYKKIPVELGPDPNGRLKFEMRGGKIIGNEAEFGGGVDINICTSGFSHCVGEVAAGVFEMSGDSIVSGNTAKQFGGGISNGAGVFRMSGNAKVTDNTAPLGGGIYLGTDILKATPQMFIENGQFCNNAASTMGDDIYSKKGSISLTVPVTGWQLDANHGGEPSPITGWYYDNEAARWNPRNFTEAGTSVNGTAALKAAFGIYSLGYDANGGSGAPGAQDTINVPNATLPVSSTTPTRPGYTFLGWSRTPNGSVEYRAGADVPMTENTTLYAVWEYNYVPYVPEFPTPTPTPTPTPVTPTPGGTTITDEETPLAGSVGLNDTDHFAYVIGYDDDTVRPLNNITRAEAATIFFRLMTDEYRQANWSTTNSFTDVNAGDWYNNAVSTCANAGVLKGYDDGTFRPNAPITRAEFASMAAGFMDESITDDGTGDFSDTVNHWAAVAIRRAAKAGWVTGTGNKFNPDAKITRAGVMTIVNRMLDRTPDKDHMLPTMKTWTDNPESEWYYEAVQEATNEHDYERDELNVETWTELLTVRDWKALETEWANNGGASAPKDETK